MNYYKVTTGNQGSVDNTLLLINLTTLEVKEYGIGTNTWNSLDIIKDNDNLDYIWKFHDKDCINKNLFYNDST